MNFYELMNFSYWGQFFGPMLNYTCYTFVVMFPSFRSAIVHRKICAESIYVQEVICGKGDVWYIPRIRLEDRSIQMHYQAEDTSIEVGRVQYHIPRYLWYEYMDRESEISGPSNLLRFLRHWQNSRNSVIDVNYAGIATTILRVLLSLPRFSGH